MIQGISKESLKEKVSREERFPDISTIIWHIGSAEVYWFFKSGHAISPRYDGNDIDIVISKLEENTAAIQDVLLSCGEEQLEIKPPSSANGPSVAWALLRTYQHGIYHAGQIAKMRHMMGLPELSDDPEDSWSSAVDSVIELISNLLAE
jgi:uncharacterized damage-inducible protein DinB